MDSYRSAAPDADIAISRCALFQRVPNLDATRTKRLLAFNRIGSLILATAALFWCLFWVNYGSTLMVIVCASFFTIAVSLVYLDRYIDSNVTFLLLTVVVALYIGLSVFIAGGVGGDGGGSPHAFLLTLSAVVYFILMGKPKILQLGLAAIIFFAFIVLELKLIHVTPILTLSPSVIESASYINWFGAIASVLLFFGWLVKDANEVERRLNISNSKFEELLEHILPPSVIHRLSEEGKTFAEGYKACTIMFTDIVNFDELNKKYSAEQLVALLNRMFADFDDATHELGAEKIKTIGDSYMVATGLPYPNPQHAEVMLKLAFQLRKVAQNYPEVQLRFGVHSGPVTAGIIGKHKFVYDVWGDTVNVAARLDRLAKKGQILVSEQTFKLIQFSFNCEKSGTLWAKGIGELNAYEVKEKLEDISHA